MIRSMRWAYAIASWVVVAAIIIQFTLAGLGVFAPPDFCDLGSMGTARLYGCFGLHALFGILVVALAILILIVLAFAARVPWRMTGLSAGLFGLMFLQALLIWPYYDLEGPVKAVSSLHVLNGILVLFVALHVAGRARDLVLQTPRAEKRSLAEIVIRPAEAKGD